MRDNIYHTFFSGNKSPMLAALVDPDKYQPAMPGVLAKENCRPDFILVGGSEVSNSTDACIADLKQKTGLPVLLFPGHPSQLSRHADAVLMLMLLSGRNPEYLIGHHISAVPFLQKHNTETISTGYILTGDHAESSVCRVSQTRPIPSGDEDLIIATAVAGQIIGNRIIYLEAGSGAGKAIDASLIAAVRKQISVTLFSGGGIRSAETATEHWKAGADVVVVGTAFEENPEVLREFAEARSRMRNGAG